MQSNHMLQLTQSAHDWWKQKSLKRWKTQNKQNHTHTQQQKTKTKKEEEEQEEERMKERKILGFLNHNQSRMAYFVFLFDFNQQRGWH